jgi:glycosyl transferase family 2
MTDTWVSGSWGPDVLDRDGPRLIPRLMPASAVEPGLMPASTPAVSALLPAPTSNGRTGILSRREVRALAAMGVRVSVVIPTLNEEENLPHVLARLPPGLHEVIVVDGHSTDHTVAVAHRLRPDVRLVMQTGRGKGNALAEGFAGRSGDIVVTLDSDGPTGAREIPRFVAALRIAKAGLVVPSYERNRIHGASNLSAVRDGGRVLRTIAREHMSAASRRLWRSRLRLPRDPVNIALIAPRSVAYPGALERHVRELARGLVRGGVTVELLSQGYEPALTGVCRTLPMAANRVRVVPAGVDMGAIRRASPFPRSAPSC